MKKFLSLFLSTVLVASLLCACSVTGNGEPYFKLKNLPNTEETETDEKTEYFHGGPVAKFIESDNYGEIVPFISEIREFHPIENNKNTQNIKSPSYGFSTLDGKIIVDGIYSEVKVLTSPDGDSVYLAQSFISTAKDLQELEKDTPLSKSYLIASDGSWVKQVGNVPYSDSELKNYIQSRDENGLLTLYSFSGETLFSQSDAMPNDTIETVYYAKNGKFIFDLSADDNSTRTVCVNDKGELLTEIKLGSYRISQMIGGVFTVYNMDGSNKSNLSDLNGNLLLKSDFDFINYDEKNSVFICTNNGKKQIYMYDMNGTLVLNFKSDCKGSEMKYVLNGNSGKSLLYQNSKGKYLIYDTTNGEKVKLDTKNVQSNGVNVLYTHLGSEKSYILLTREDKTNDLYDAYGTYITTFNDYLDSFDITPNGDYCYNSTDGKFIVRSRTPVNDFEIDFKSDGIENFTVYSYGSKYITFICTDENGENGYFRVYDLETKEIAFDKLSAFESFTVGEKTFYAVADDNTTTLLSENSQEIIRIGSKEGM